MPRRVRETAFTPKAQPEPIQSLAAYVDLRGLESAAAC